MLAEREAAKNAEEVLATGRRQLQDLLFFGAVCAKRPHRQYIQLPGDLNDPVAEEQLHFSKEKLAAKEVQVDQLLVASTLKEEEIAKKRAKLQEETQREMRPCCTSRTDVVTDCRAS